MAFPLDSREMDADARTDAAPMLLCAPYAATFDIIELVTFKSPIWLLLQAICLHPGEHAELKFTSCPLCQNGIHVIC
jgi:hypothetical protein